ncbi:unnamed protein product, partial [Nesidiocoris tenuis]
MRATRILLKQSDEPCQAEGIQRKPVVSGSTEPFFVRKQRTDAHEYPNKSKYVELPDEKICPARNNQHFPTMNAKIIFEA